MPGPISDSYDTGRKLKHALYLVNHRLTAVLGGSPPMSIVDLIDSDLPKVFRGKFTEKEWRLIRFALERAGESI